MIEAPIFSLNLGPHNRTESRAQDNDTLQQVIMNVATGRYRLGIVRDGELVQQVRVGLGVTIPANEAGLEEVPYGLTSLQFPLQRDGERLALMVDLGIAEAALQMYISERYTTQYGVRELSFYDQELLLKTFAIIDLALQHSLFVDTQGDTPVRLSLKRTRLTDSLRRELEKTIAEIRPDFLTNPISHVRWLTAHFPRSNTVIGSTTGDEDRDRQVNPAIADALKSSDHVSGRDQLHRTLALIRADSARRQADLRERELHAPASLDEEDEDGLSLHGVIAYTAPTQPVNDEQVREQLIGYGLDQFHVNLILDHYLDGLTYQELDGRYGLKKGQASAMVRALIKDQTFMTQLHAYIASRVDLRRTS